MLFEILTTSPFIVCCVITVMLMLSWRRQPNSVVGWLTVWAAVTTLLYASHIVYFRHVTWLLAVSDAVYTACNLTVYPLYLIYISEQTDLKPLSSRPWMIVALLLPGLLGGASSFMLFMVMDDATKQQFFDTFLYHDKIEGLQGVSLLQAHMHHAYQALFGLEVAGVAVAGIRKERRYDRILVQLCADTDDKTLRPVSVILQLFVATSVLSIVALMIGRNRFVDSLWVAVPSLAFSALLFSIGWVGMNRTITLRQINANVVEDTAQEETTTAQRSDLALKERLEQLMIQERVFLRQDLRLDQVAQMLGTNRTYLLATLRNEMGMTFKEYINRQRIAYAEELMRRAPNLPKGEIANQSGYNTPSSFYRNMKAYGHH